MNKKHKIYLRLNIMSLFFIAVSFISITLAWFAYSGLATVATEVGVKAWYIEFQKGTDVVSNNIVISLSDIYPGMETVHETVNIKNLGDSDAGINYFISSARILGDASDNYILSDTITSKYIEDKISHDYPFHVNISLSKNYAKAKDGSSTFEVSVSWPLDSDNDTLDSTWGNKAYAFQKNEEEKFKNNPNYEKESSLKIVISVKAEQYTETTDSSDMNYNLGDIVLYDVVNNSKCDAISSTCLKMYVMDPNNTLGDTNVNLLPDLYNTYNIGTFDNYNTLYNDLISSWKVVTRPLEISDLLKVISKDPINSLIIREGLSNDIVGNLEYGNRIETELNKLISYNGYYKFDNNHFNFLTSGKCYWINKEYNVNNAFSLVRIDGNNSKIYGNLKTESCSVVPIVTVSKTKLEG